jgi:hypothetical protein
MWNYGDAKPCSIYINQGKRSGVVTLGHRDDYHVAYVLPNGRHYAKRVTREDAEQILTIAMKLSVKPDGTLVFAWGF